MNRIRQASDIEPGMVLQWPRLGKGTPFEVVQLGEFRYPCGQISQGVEIRFLAGRFLARDPFWVGCRALLGARVIA